VKEKGCMSIFGQQFFAERSTPRRGGNRAVVGVHPMRQSQTIVRWLANNMGRTSLNLHGPPLVIRH
jgi:hypothetical protein